MKRRVCIVLFSVVLCAAAPAAEVLALLRIHGLQFAADTAAGMDRSGALPGLPTGPASWRSFITRLAEEQAGGFWYCLIQAGTASMPTAAMGWSWPDRPGPQTADRLAGLGLDAAKLAVAVRSDGERQTLTLAADAATLAMFSDGPPQETAGAMRPDGSGAELWFAARPVIGALSFLADVDLRGILTSLGLEIPPSGTIGISPSKNDRSPVVTVSFHKIFSTGSETEQRGSSREKPLAASPRHTEGIRLFFPSPESVAALLGRADNQLFLLNMDSRILMPEEVCVDIRLTRENRPLAWRAVCAMKPYETIQVQWKRLLAWLDFLFDAQPDTDGRVHFAYGGADIWLRLQTTDHGVFLCLAGSDNDLPLSKDIADVGLPWALEEDGLLAAWDAADTDGRQTRGSVRASGSDLVMDAPLERILDLLKDRF